MNGLVLLAGRIFPEKEKGQLKMCALIIDSQIIASVVGGFLAAGTGWLLQNRLEASRISKLKGKFYRICKAARNQ